MFYAKNLSSSAMESGQPWLFTDRSRVPAECFSDKAARSAWATNPLTDFHCYTLFEGVNRNARLTRADGTSDGNPPIYMHGMAVDYDYALTDAEIDAGLARMEPKPNWRETTLSGNCRLIWMFPEPVPIPTFAFAVAFLESLDQIIPFRHLAGIDEGALNSPERLFTNGCIWKKLSPLYFPKALLMGHLIKFSEKFDWKGPEFGITMPLDIVAGKLKEKYPGFANWPGDFALNMPGPSFWVEGSTSPKSAIVRETGIQTFSAHAHKPFFSWPELIGAEFCATFKTEQLGKACEGIYYDEKHYHSKNSFNVWCIDPKENIVGLLKGERGASDVKRKGETLTEVEKALVYIQRQHRIKNAANYAFYPEGVTNILGERVLNTHTKRTISPSPDPAVWGPEGGFPFLSQFLDTLFTTPDQKPFFLSWLSYFYAACYRRTPRSGHAVFLAGGTNVGKTFLSRGVIGGLMGGFSEANQFLLGEDNFNNELFDHAVWVVDDGSIATNHQGHRRFSEMVKRMVANPSIRCNGKFLKANTVQWQGRIFVTLDTDADSVRMLPDLDLSLREKLMIFRAVETAAVKFLPQAQMEEMLSRELPQFARYLLDFTIPVECQSGDPRFGVLNFLEPSLVSVSNQSSASGTFSEIVEEWMKSYFLEREPHAEVWEGTALQMHKSILADLTLTEAMRPYNVQSVGRMLVNLAAKGVFGIQISGDERKRTFIIKRDLTQMPKTAPGAALLKQS